MINHWKSLDLEITDFSYQQDPTQSGETIQYQISNLKQVAIRNVSNKPTQHTSLESFFLENTDFKYLHDPTPSGETKPSRTSNP